MVKPTFDYLEGAVFMHKHDASDIENLDLSGYIPYTGATTDVDLGDNNFTVGDVSWDQTSKEFFITSDVQGQGVDFKLAWDVQVIPGFPFYFPFEFGVTSTGKIFGGQRITYSGDGVIAFGTDASATGFGSIAIGSSTNSSNSYTLALGKNAIASGDNSVGINGQSSGSFSTSIGGDARGDNSLALGKSARAYNVNSVAIGSNAFADGDNAVAIGQFTRNSKDDSILLAQSYLDGGATTIAPLLEAELFKGVRVGATSGETITMAGTDLYVAGQAEIGGDSIVIATSKTPSSATDTGIKGQICYDSDYVYVCTATNTWKRTAISTW